MGSFENEDLVDSHGLRVKRIATNLHDKRITRRRWMHIKSLPILVNPINQKTTKIRWQLVDLFHGSV